MFRPARPRNCRSNTGQIVWRGIGAQPPDRCAPGRRRSTARIVSSGRRAHSCPKSRLSVKRHFGAKRGKPRERRPRAAAAPAASTSKRPARCRAAARLHVVTAIPDTQYLRTDRGLIAYQVLGDGPIDLMYLSGGTSNVDLRWDYPVAASFLRRLSSFSRLIMFDRLGTGASDRVAAEATPTWEEWADEIRLVLDAVESERVAIFAVLDAVAMGILFAATHPARTSALILGNASARYRADEGYPGLDDRAAEEVAGWFESAWGTEEFATALTPASSALPGFTQWFAKYMRGSASPRLIAAQLRSGADLDLRDVLPSIRVPTLVLQREAFAFIPLEHGKYIADHVPDARLVVVPGADSSFLSAESDLVLDVVEEFLTGVRPPLEPDRALATVLFTDIVDSTLRAVEAGDRAWRRALDSHDDLARVEIDRHGGRLIKTTGDGVLATFDAPGRAVRCALALVAGVAALGIAIRAGLHTGEVELRGDDIGGIAVHTAARVGALATSGEVLVSRTVVDLVAGSGLGFDDRGEHILKGVPGTWTLFAARS